MIKIVLILVLFCVHDPGETRKVENTPPGPSIPTMYQKSKFLYTSVEENIRAKTKTNDRVCYDSHQPGTMEQTLIGVAGKKKCTNLMYNPLYY